MKPDLVFFKQFTEEDRQYMDAKTRSENEVRQKYIGEINTLTEKIATEKSKKVRDKSLIAGIEKQLRNLKKLFCKKRIHLLKSILIMKSRSLWLRILALLLLVRFPQETNYPSR